MVGRGRKEGQSSARKEMGQYHSSAAVFGLCAGSYAVESTSYLTHIFGSPESGRELSTRAITDCRRVPASPSTSGAGRVWAVRHVYENFREEEDVRTGAPVVARPRGGTRTTATVPWLILPVVICLSQRLSHACLSASHIKVKPRMAH